MNFKTQKMEKMELFKSLLKSKGSVCIDECGMEQPEFNEVCKLIVGKGYAFTLDEEGAGPQVVRLYDWAWRQLEKEKVGELLISIEN